MKGGNQEVGLIGYPAEFWRQNLVRITFLSLFNMEYPQIDPTLLQEVISTSYWDFSPDWLERSGILALPGRYITTDSSVVDINNIWDYIQSLEEFRSPKCLTSTIHCSFRPIGELHFYPFPLHKCKRVETQCIYNTMDKVWGRGEAVEGVMNTAAKI